MANVLIRVQLTNCLMEIEKTSHPAMQDHFRVFMTFRKFKVLGRDEGGNCVLQLVTHTWPLWRIYVQYGATVKAKTGCQQSDHHTHSDNNTVDLIYM